MSVSKMNNMVVEVPAVVVKKMNEVVRGVVRVLGEKYGFDEEEALVYLSLKKEEGKERGMKCSFQVPFDGVVKENCCFGVKKSGGLYNQCTMAKKDGEWCKGCVSQKLKGKDYGDIRERAAMGEEWRAPDGSKATSFSKIMKKNKLTREMVEEELTRCGMVMLSEAHFEEEKSSRGRPKKSEESSTGSKKRGRPAKKSEKAVEVTSVEDMVSKMIEDAKEAEEEEEGVVEEEAVVSDLSDTESESSKKKTTKKAAGGRKITSAEKEAKEADKFAAKQAKEAEKLAAKQAKEAEKLAAKEAKEAEKLAAKQAKEAEKLAAKEAKQASKKTVPKKKEEEEEEEEEEGENEEVKRFKYKGTDYLKSSSGKVYDMEEEEVGSWCEKTKSIVWKGKGISEELETEDDEDSEDEE
jgi:hypothetical protein